MDCGYVNYTIHIFLNYNFYLKFIIFFPTYYIMARRSRKRSRTRRRHRSVNVVLPQQENAPVVAADPVDSNVVNLNNNINII